MQMMAMKEYNDVNSTLEPDEEARETEGKERRGIE